MQEPDGDRSDLHPSTPLDALGVLATSDVMVTDALRHVELYTRQGLLSLWWHEPAPTAVSDDRRTPPLALVMCGGAMGGVLGPGAALYHRLGEAWSARGVPVVRVGYRRPNDLDLCCIDVAAATQLVVGTGADKVVLMGHSFGGAVAVRVGVGLRPVVGGVVTFATQSAGCEAAAGLEGLPLLLFHGERDEILPPEASDMVRMIAGSGEVVRLPGDGHMLARSDELLFDRVGAFLEALLDR